MEEKTTEQNRVKTQREMDGFTMRHWGIATQFRREK